jgi:hypothetical protein
VYTPISSVSTRRDVYHRSTFPRTRTGCPTTGGGSGSGSCAERVHAGVEGGLCAGGQYAKSRSYEPEHNGVQRLSRQRGFQRRRWRRMEVPARKYARVIVRCRAFSPVYRSTQRVRTRKHRVPSGRQQSSQRTRRSGKAHGRARRSRGLRISHKRLAAVDMVRVYAHHYTVTAPFHCVDLAREAGRNSAARERPTPDRRVT